MTDQDKDKLLAQLREARAWIDELEAEPSNRWLMLALEQVAETIVITDADATIQYVNPAFEATTGYSREAAIGQNPRILKSGEHDDAFYRQMWDVLTSGETWSGTLVNRKKDGTRYVEDATISPVRNADGMTISYVAVKHDVTERRRAEEELARFSRVLERSLNEIYLFDAETLRFVTVNRGARENLGYTIEELRALTPLDLKPEFTAEAFAELVAPLRSGEQEKVEFTTVHRRKDGTLYPVEVHLQLMTMGIPLFVAVILDITERVQAQEEREKLQAQLLHSQKMEAVGRLAGGVAHDFNNVLCVIMAHSQLAISKLAAEDPLRQSLGEVFQAATRAADLTRQLLAFSRKQLIEPKVIDLGAVIEGLHSMLVRLIGEDIILRTKIQDDLGRVLLDPGQVEQIVLNLAVNARDAMPDGGELVIEASNFQLTQSESDLHAGAGPGPYVVLTVRDTGSGMDEETRARIFEPFFTTKTLGKGTGLGLATVFGIVEQNNGWIEVESQKGRGTIFRLYFARVFDEAESIRRPDVAVVAGAGSETVLVVEDDDAVRRLVVKILKERGYEVLAASSGGDALSLAAARHEPIDLLVTDVVMPHMNGRELANKLAELWPGLRVLYSSGYTQRAIASHGVLYPGVQFIAKPFTPNQLAAKVRKLLDR